MPFLFTPVYFVSRRTSAARIVNLNSQNMVMAPRPGNPDTNKSRFRHNSATI